jgi:hypothetical protein
LMMSLLPFLFFLKEKKKLSLKWCIH